MYDSTNKIIYKLYAWKNADATTPIIYTKIPNPTITGDLTQFYTSSGVLIPINDARITASTSTTVTVSIDSSSVVYTYSIGDDKGVSIYDIQRAVGRSTADLGYLCGDVMKLYAWINSSVTYYTSVKNPVVGSATYTISNDKRVRAGLITAVTSNENNQVTSIQYNSVIYDRYDTGDTLIPTNKINKWSKYKPIAHNALFELTDEQIISNNYGLTIPVYTTLYDVGSTPGILTDIILDNKRVWSYSKPQGTVNSPYRMHDFLRYSRSAQPQLSPPSAHKYFRDIYHNVQIDCDSNNDEYSVPFDALHIGNHPEVTVSSMYLGIVLVNSDRTLFATSQDSTIANGGYSIIFENVQDSYVEDSSNEYNCYFFASSLILDGPNITQDTLLIPFELSPTHIVIYNSSVKAMILISELTSLTTINWSIQLEERGVSNENVGAATISVKDYSDSSNPTTVGGGHSLNSGSDIVVSPDNPYVESGEFTRPEGFNTGYDVNDLRLVLEIPSKGITIIQQLEQSSE